MSRERCNCDASCGENRYHDQGDAICAWADIPSDLWHLDISAARLTVLEEEWKRNDRRITLKSKTENVMTKVTRIRDKLVKVSESFTVNMYDNGFMVEISGRDPGEDWKTSKIMVATVDELVSLIREATEMERDS